MTAAAQNKSVPAKDQVYEDILPQIAVMIRDEDDLVATLSGITGILAGSFGHLDRGQINIVDALYLERVFDLLHRKYCAGGAGGAG
jgi:hypothetical protein